MGDEALAQIGGQLFPRILTHQAESNARQVVLSASSGHIEFVGATRDAVFDTSSGDIDAAIRPLGGRVVASASSGDITLAFDAPSTHGFDVIADASSGDVTVDIPDGVTLSEEPTHVRTVGFEHRAVRTSVVAEASSGDVTVTA